jgi:hypothetical protein
MTVANKFTSYQRGYPSPDKTTMNTASPNVGVIINYLRHNHKMTNLGIYNKRPIRGGTAWSSHAYGAAGDCGYTDRAHIESVVIPWLIENSAELGIQRIHDYAAKRYWQAGSGWINRPPGEGGNWLHIETHPDHWATSTTVESRIGAPSEPGTQIKFVGKPIKIGSTGERVKIVQQKLGMPTDGKFGPVTDKAVKQFQTENGLTSDGVVGPVTWGKMFSA